jgi:hypothetical protein
MFVCCKAYQPTQNDPYSKYFFGIFSFSLILTKKFTENEENKFFPMYLHVHTNFENAGSGHSKQTIMLTSPMMRNWHS